MFTAVLGKSSEKNYALLMYTSILKHVLMRVYVWCEPNS